MVGGTRIHRQIHERALVEMKEREEFLLGEENTSPAARTLFVSLDRADAIIEGAPSLPVWFYARVGLGLSFLRI